MKYVPGTLELMEHPKCVAAPHYPKKKIIQTFISLRVLPFFPFLFKQQSAVFPITGYFQCVMNEWPLMSGSKSRSLFVYPLRAHHSFSAVSESVLAIPVCQTHGKDGGEKHQRILISCRFVFCLLALGLDLFGIFKNPKKKPRASPSSFTASVLVKTKEERKLYLF